MNKYCNRCEQTKDISNFYFRRLRNNYYSLCRECTKREKRKYYHENKHKLLKAKSLRAKNYPEKLIAKDKAKYYIKKILPCRVCNSNKTERHHPDYSKPLEVIFLCHEHHIQLHVKLNKLLAEKG